MDFSSVIQRLRNVISSSSTHKVRDKDIAHALDLSPQYFAVIKKRKKIPYESISYFCKQHKINMNWILHEQNPQYLT